MIRTARVQRIAGGIAIVFGAVTIISGGAALLGAVQMGAIVPFVLWFNTVAGLAYVVAGFGLWQGRAWAFPLSLGIFATTLIVFAGFGLHVSRGGSYETRTLMAMALRSIVWGILALIARQAPVRS
jgi:hypothetical protein